MWQTDRVLSGMLVGWLQKEEEEQAEDAAEKQEEMEEEHQQLLGGEEEDAFASGWSGPEDSDED